MNKNRNLNKSKELITTDKERGIEIKTPLPYDDDSEKIIKLFPKRKPIPLFDVFNEVNQATCFIDSFEPFAFNYECKINIV